ncbi:MAG: PDZ domain-containing protein [Anaerolineae bacterium]|nr:PDZ domain-containing protein [Phycisphaerae bacterium]
MNQTLRTGVRLAVTATIFSCLTQNRLRAQDSPTTKSAAGTFATASVTSSSPSVAPAFAKKLYEDVSPSLVAVQYTWEYEFGKADFVEPGVVVSADGLILLPGAELLPRMPAGQIRDVKIIIPHLDKDNEEIEAELLGRDQRSEVVFIRAKEKRDWKPIKFVDETPAIGDPIVSVGMLSRDAGYRTYLAESIVGAYSRGEIPTIVATGGGLANVGAPVFNTAGQAIGWVNYYASTQFLLHTTLARRGEQIEPLAPLMSPPRIFVPTSVFAKSLTDPPTAGQPPKLPWLGMPNLSGVDKDVAQVFGLENQPAVEVGDVVPNSPADKAGIKIGMKIVKVNGQPLERGDLVEELPGILARKIMRMPVGTQVTFGVLTEKDQPMKDFTVTLGERPLDNTWAKRAWAEDLGFGTRNLVFEDTYARKQPADLKGVIVTMIKPNSAAASAKLAREDIITQFNSMPVSDVDQFESTYKAFRSEKPKEAIVLVIMKRDGTTQTIRIEPPQ